MYQGVDSSYTCHKQECTYGLFNSCGAPATLHLDGHVFLTRFFPAAPTNAAQKS